MKKYVLMLLVLALVPFAVQAKEVLEPKNIPALQEAFETGNQDEFIALQIRVIRNSQNSKMAVENADNLFKTLIEQVMYLQANASDAHEASDLDLLKNALVTARDLHAKLATDLKNRHSDMQALLYQLEDFASNYASVIKKVEEIAHQAGVHLDFDKLLHDMIDHTYQLEEEGSYSLSALAGRVQRHFEGTTTPTWSEQGKNFYDTLNAAN